MAKDKAKVSAYNKDYWLKNRDRLAEKNRAKVRKWQKENKPKRNETQRNNTKKQRERDGTSKNAQVNRRRRRRLKQAIVAHYGGACVCCGEHELDFMSVDHINGGGTEHRRTLRGGGRFYKWLMDQNFPDGYQILCFNCNYSKYLGGVCAHKRNLAADEDLPLPSLLDIESLASFDPGSRNTCLRAVDDDSAYYCCHGVDITATSNRVPDTFFVIE